MLCNTREIYLLNAFCFQIFKRKTANLDASLFFSFLDFGRTAMGSSLTGVMSLISRLSLSSSRPMLWSLRGFGVKSLPSPRLAFPLLKTTILGITTIILFSKDFEPVFDSIDRAVRTKNGVLNLVQNMWIDRLWSQADFVSFWAFGLNVVLPEESFFLSRRRTGMGFTSTFFVTASRIWCWKRRLLWYGMAAAAGPKLVKIPESESSKSS